MSEWLARAQLDRLYSHAIAAQRWPELGLVDSAAAQLMSIVSGGDRTSVSRAEPLAVVRSRALDARCLTFLQEEPNALVINIGAGLNTRFHRLSQQLDWPRFHWLELDSPELVKAQQAYLPLTDHYRCRGVSAEQLTSDVQKALQQWQGAVLIMAESPAAWLSADQWQMLLALCSQTPNNARCDIVYDYLSPGARRRICYWGAALRRLYPQAHFASPVVPAPWQVRHRTDLHGDTRCRIWGHWYTAHLSVS